LVKKRKGRQIKECKREREQVAVKMRKRRKEIDMNTKSER
jgi:hypothetical protein